MSETDYDYLDAILSVRRTDSASTTTMDVPTSKLSFDYYPETPLALMGFIRELCFTTKYH